MIDLFSDLKDLIEAVIGLDRNVLHVHLGILLFLLLAWCLPEPHRYRRALVWLLIIELVNEFFDALVAYDRQVRPNWPDAVADIINTLIWPTLWCVFRQRIVRALRSDHRAGEQD